jgi:hypothetical protein
MKQNSNSHDVILFRKNEFLAVHDRGRCRERVVRVFGIDKGMPNPIDHGEENIAFDESPEERNARPFGRDSSDGGENGAVVGGGSDGLHSPRVTPLAHEMKDRRHIARVAEPDVNVAHEIPQGVSRVAACRVNVAGAVVILVVVVLVRVRESAREDAEKGASDPVEGEPYAHRVQPIHKNAAKCMELLVSKSIRESEIFIHGPDAEHVEREHTPPHETVLAGVKRLVDAERGNDDREPDHRRKNKPVAFVLHKDLEALPACETAGEADKIERTAVGALPQCAQRNLCRKIRKSRQKYSATKNGHYVVGECRVAVQKSTLRLIKRLRRY